ncbi:MAG: helix-turn-helix transcriptional regulator [Caldilineaceae bacterium SB0664_bin_27]|uniref:Helix-turn-helix transcriptional regulator n=1 Tax=Caldilineaceae bacterium SB0664_bin_27 TaxID=2605260 RepID=A0A6B0YPG7_9CHLR|nr:helix-turn-helix transcriptional regulator [Caldilineaceae bacterium SB0664_bin_27]
MQGRHTLGRRIRRLRNAAGLSQDALARAAGIRRVTLVRLERGEQTPRYKTLRAIARALEVDVSDLLVEREILRRYLEYELVFSMEQSANQWRYRSTSLKRSRYGVAYRDSLLS